MKKIIPLLTISGLLILSGCSNGNTSIDNKKDVLLTVGDEEITHGEVFDVLKMNGNVDPIIAALNKQVVEIAVPVTKELEKQADKALAEAKETVGDGDAWTTFLSDGGFKDEVDFYENEILFKIREGLITTSYINENLEDMLVEYTPTQLQIIAIDNEESATEAFNKLEEGTDFDDLKSYDNVETNDPSTRIVLQPELSKATWDAIDKTENGETISIVGNDATLETYYLVKVIEKDSSVFESEVVSVIAESTATNGEALTMAQEALHRYLTLVDYKIHDASIYSFLLGTNPAYTRD